MFKTIELVSPTFRPLIHIPCVAHGLHNCVKASLKKSEGLMALVEKCHNLVLIFQSSPKMEQQLAQERQQNDRQPLSVILDVATRWNSTLAMLRRLVDLREDLDHMSFRMDDKNAARLRKLLPSDIEWQMINIMIKILDPFDSLTKIFSSSQYGLAALIGPRIIGLLDNARGEMRGMTHLSASIHSVLQEFYQNLVQEVKNRIQSSKELAMITALHPSFNTLWFYSDSNFRESVIRLLRKEYNEIAPPVPAPTISTIRSTYDDDPTIFSLFKRRRREVEDSEADERIVPNEVDTYLELRVDLVDPFEWWRENATKFPNLAQLADFTI